MANIQRRGEYGYPDLRREIDRLFEDFFTPGAAAGPRSVQEFSPRMEVTEQGDRYVLRAELPGVAPEQVELNVDNNVLTLHGERSSEESKTERGYKYSECSYGAFSRSIQLPEGVDASKIQADFKHGMLEIQIPKGEATRPRRIAIGGQAQSTPQMAQGASEPKAEAKPPSAAPTQGQQPAPRR